VVVRTGTGVGHADGQAGARGGSPASVVDGGAGNGREGRLDGDGGAIRRGGSDRLGMGKQWHRSTSVAAVHYGEGRATGWWTGQVVG
jgi:hypothetical protein